jgi:hypothetical protein
MGLLGNFPPGTRVQAIDGPRGGEVGTVSNKEIPKGHPRVPVDMDSDNQWVVFRPQNLEILE